MTRADSATLLARFSEALREAGVAVSPDQTIRLARLASLGVPSTVDELYWCARVSLLRSTADIPAFDAVFALVFRGIVDVAESRGDSSKIQLPPQRDFPLFDEEPGADVQSKGRFGGSESTVGDDVGRPVPTLASSDERLTEVDFARLTADELAALAPLLRMLWVNPPRRLSRRRRRHRRGDQLDVRASLRHSTRSGGDPAVPIRRTRKWTPRRVVAPARHLRVDGAVRSRLPAPALGCGNPGTQRGFRVRYAAHPADTRAARRQPRSGARARSSTDARLVGWHAHRALVTRVHGPPWPAGDGARCRRADRLRWLGAR